jgi:putative oxidoreductase
MTTVLRAIKPDLPCDTHPRYTAVLTKLFSTSSDVAPLVARVSLGLIMFPHGAQHALGWYGGYGFGGTLEWMTQTLGFPAPFAALAIATELIAPFALVLGFGGRLAALGISGLMLGAASTHASNGFFMNWFGTLPAGAEGYEYHLMALALSIVVILSGSGVLSIDASLASRLTAGRTVRPRTAHAR